MKGETNMGVLTPRQEKLLMLFKNAVESERQAQKAYTEMLPFNDDPALNNHLLKQVDLILRLKAGHFG